MLTSRKPRSALVDARKKLGLSQEDLASKVGISRGYLSNVEAGKFGPSLKIASRIAKVLNKSVEDLFL
ncbi:helix-turn-helix transcriptional regulator [Sediminibacillus massiliensis]|uniref:helix-turn-helix transcriptional regulator n=1 Tax=Sediminibacillus massiliensis TaxID=1926277 RepID=UPI0009887211|nr:helix-turn-helix transcriptional regulator [Sediminibacillus massiliensis]